MSKISEDLQDADGKWRASYRLNGVEYVTKVYRLWTNMKTRCLVGGAYQNKRPTYIGCTLSSKFQDFQFFADWCHAQVGYGLDGYEIDKDLLVAGNKVYGERNCVFIPRALNSFLISQDSRRGKYPQGVLPCGRQSKKFRVTLSVSGVGMHKGNYDTVEEAAAVYKVAKEAEARRWYNRLKAGEFVVDERVIERMRTWTHTSETANIPLLKIYECEDPKYDCIDIRRIIGKELIDAEGQSKEEYDEGRY